MNKRFPFIGTGIGKGGFRGGGFKGGVGKFTDLTDAPHNYTGQGGKIVQVNGTETGLAFISEPAIDRHDVKTTSDDTDPSFLDSKIITGDNLQTDIIDDSGAKQLKISFEKGYEGTAYWLPPVISIFDNTSGLPSSPSDGDRYIAKVTANGWDANQIYQYYSSVSDWIHKLISAGSVLYNQDDKFIYFWNGYIWKKVNALFWQEPVLSVFDNSIALPAGPEQGDRYIAKVTANGWTKDFIYEYNAGSWYETSAIHGMVLIALDEDRIYKYIGESWSALQFIKLADTPETYTGQAGKQLRVNDTEIAIEFDTLFWIDPVSGIYNDPPGSPEEGGRWIVGSTPSGAWIGHESEIAVFKNSSWSFLTPQQGFTAFLKDTIQIRTYITGEFTGWQLVGGLHGLTDSSIHGGGLVAELQNLILDGKLFTTARDEIHVQTEKTELTKADEFLIEDSETSPTFQKKKSTFQDVAVSIISEADSAEAEAAAFARGARIVIRTDLL